MGNLFSMLTLCISSYDQQHQEQRKKKNPSSRHCYFKSDDLASNGDKDYSLSAYFEMTMESLCPWKF